MDTIQPDVDRVAALYAHDAGEWAARPAIVKEAAFGAGIDDSTESLPARKDFVMNVTFDQINHAAALVVPEIVLLATVCVMFLVGPFMVSETGQAAPGLRHRWGGLALLALGVAWLIWFNSRWHASRPM